MNYNQNQAPDNVDMILARGLQRLYLNPNPIPPVLQVNNGNELAKNEARMLFEPRKLMDLALTKLIDSDIFDENELIVKRFCKPVIYEEYVHICESNIWYGDDAMIIAPNMCDNFVHNIEVYESFDDFSSIQKFIEVLKSFADVDDDCLDIATPLRISLWRVSDIQRIFHYFREDWVSMLRKLDEVSYKLDPKYCKDLTQEGVEPNPGPIGMTFSEREVVEGVNWFETPFCPECMLRFIPKVKHVEFDARTDMSFIVELVEVFDWNLVRSAIVTLTRILNDLNKNDESPECRHIPGTWLQANVVKTKIRFPRLLYFYLLKLADINFEGKDILEALRKLLVAQGIEPNPGPVNLNGNTKRDSKTRRSEERTKFESLPEFHEKKKQQKYKRHLRALDCEKRAVLRERANSDFEDHEFDDLIKTEAFGIDFTMFKGFSVDVKFDIITDLFNHLKNFLRPDAQSEKVLLGHLTTMVVFFRTDDWMIRFATLVANWPQLGDKSTGIYTLLVLADCLINWLRNGDVNAPWYGKKDVPKEIRTEAFEEGFDLASMSSFQAIGALILSLCGLFLLNKIPGKGDFDSFMRRCDVFSKGARGIENIYGYAKKIINAAVVFCEEKMFGESVTLMSSIDGKLQKLCDEIKCAATIENKSRLLTHRTQVDLVDALFRRSLDMLDLLKLGGLPTQRQAFIPYFSVIRELHKQASVSPISGRGFRQQPKFFQLAGRPGVGKTRLAWILSIDFLRELGLNEGQMREYASYIYFRKVGEKYWTNYNAEMHRVCVCDDASQLFEEHGEGVPFFAEIIHLANNAECPLNVAEVDLKKFARFNSEVIISTDNNRNPNLGNILRDPTAYRRRIDLQVEVRVKPEFGELYRDAGAQWYRLRPEFAADVNLRTDIYEFDITDPVTGNVVQRNLSYGELFARMRTGLRRNHEEFINFGAALSNYATRVGADDVQYAPLREELHGREDEPLIHVEGVFEWLRSPYRNMDVRHWYEDQVGGLVPCLPEMPKIGDKISRLKTFMTEHKWDFAAGLLIALPAISYMLYKYLYPKKPYKRVRKHCEPLSWTDDDGQVWYEVPGVREFKYQLGWSEEKLFDEMVDYLFRICSDDDLPYDTPMRKMTKWNHGHISDEFYQDTMNCLIWFQGHFELLEEGEDPGDAYVIWERLAESEVQPKRRAKMQRIAEMCREYNREDPKKATKKQDKGKGKQIIVESGQGKLLKRTQAKYHSTERVPLTEAYSDPNTAEFVKHRIFNNLYRIRVADEDASYGMHCLFIKGKVAIAARHLLEDMRVKEGAFVYLDCPSLAVPYRIPLSDVKTRVIRGDDGYPKDVVFLIFPDPVHKHSDITGMFNSRDELERINHVNAQLTCFDIMGDGQKKLDMLSSLRFVIEGKPKTERISAQTGDGSVISYTDYYEYVAETFPGCCGAPVLAVDARIPKKILGIHVAGSKGMGYAQVVTSEEVQAVLSGIETQCLVSAPNISLIGSEEWKPSKHFKESGYYPLGTANAAVFTAKQTQISESPIHGLVAPPITKPANLEDFEINGEKINMDFNLNKYFGPSNVYIPQDDLQILEDYGVKAFAIDEENEYLMRTLTYEEAIRGVEGEEYLPSMNRQTSPGYPFVLKRKGKGKTQWLGKDGDFNVDNVELKTEVETLLDHASQGICDPVVFTALFKDERRPIAKVDAGKTRIFAGGPMHFTIAIRMFFLGFCAAFMKQRIRNGSLVGSDVHSGDWTRFVKYLNEVSDLNEQNFIAGDHSNFDGSLNLQMLWVVYRIIERLYKRKSLTTYVLWSCICNCVLLFRKMLFMLTHSQPSGNPLTTIINTIYGRILFFYTLLLLLRDVIEKGDDEQVEIALVIIKKIDDYFRAGIYGDDITAVLNHDLRNLMTPDDITRKMLTLGHIFTDELKTTGKQEYRSLYEVSILKRRFVFQPTMNRWMAPLELSVILEMLNWDKCSNKFEKYEQLTTNIQTACIEFVYHGKEVYDFWTEKIRTAINEAGLDGKVDMPFMTYDDFCILVHRRGLGLKAKINNFLPW